MQGLEGGQQLVTGWYSYWGRGLLKCGKSLHKVSSPSVRAARTRLFAAEGVKGVRRTDTKVGGSGGSGRRGEGVKWTGVVYCS